MQGTKGEMKSVFPSLFSAGAKFVSPYSGYTGQVRSSVYQPTELALMTKAVGPVSINVYGCSL